MLTNLITDDFYYQFIGYKGTMLNKKEKMLFNQEIIWLDDIKEETIFFVGLPGTFHDFENLKWINDSYISLCKKIKKFFLNKYKKEINIYIKGFYMDINGKIGSL